jgi:hypothetical protein
MMGELNMIPGVTILIKGFSGWPFPFAITLISEKLFAYSTASPGVEQSGGSDRRVDK